MTDDPVRTRLTLVDGARDLLPGVLRGPPPRRRRAVGALRRRRRGAARPRRAGRHRPGRGRRGVPVQPDRVDRSDPGGARASPTRWPPAAARWWRSPPSSPAPPSRVRPTACWPSSATRPRWWAWRALYAEFVGTLVVDDADAALADAVEACGVRCVVAPTVMHTPADAAALASLLLDAGRRSATPGPTMTRWAPPPASPRPPGDPERDPGHGMGEIGRATTWPP